LENNKALLNKKFQVLDKFFDFTYTPVVQSGGQYNLKPTAESDQKNLALNVIILQLAGRYFDFNCSLQRTLLINPTEKEQSFYLALLSLFNEIQRNLKPGSSIGDCIGKSLESFKKKFPDLVQHLP
jgi:nucleosome binding factor SPN SPT16 subunit